MMTAVCPVSAVIAHPFPVNVRRSAGADGDPVDPAFQEHPAGALRRTRPSARAARQRRPLANLYCAGANHNDETVRI